MWSVAALNKKFDDELGTYDSLSDPLLSEYFKRPNVRDHLIQNGLMTPGGEIIPDAKSKLSNDRRKQLTKLLDETIENGQSLDGTKAKLENLYETKELERMLRARLVQRAKKVYSGSKASRSSKAGRIGSKEEFSREYQVNKWISGQVQEQIVPSPSFPRGDDDELCNGAGKNKKNDTSSMVRKSRDTNDASYTGFKSKSNKCRSQSITSLGVKREGGNVGREGVKQERRMNVSNNSRPHSSYGLRRNSIASLAPGDEKEVERIEKLVLDEVISLEGDSWKDSSSEAEPGEANNNTSSCFENNGNTEHRNGSINLTPFGSERGEGNGRGTKLQRDVFTPTYSFGPSSGSIAFSTTPPSSLIASKIQRERKSITAQLTLRFDGITSTSSDSRSIKVFQEIDRGCHSFLVFCGTQVNPGQHFSFKVVRKAKKPFSLSVFVDDVRDLRISTCCEYKHVPGVRLGHFTIVNVTGGGMQCEYCTGSISWKEFWRNKKRRKKSPLASPLKGTPSPVNTIQDDDRRAALSSAASSPTSSVLSEVDYREELEEYNKEAFEEDDSLLQEEEEVPNRVEERGNRNEGSTLTKEGGGGRKEAGRGEINEMEKKGKNGKRGGSVESLRNGSSSSFQKDGKRKEGKPDRSGRGDEKEHFQVDVEEIEDFPLSLSSTASKGTEIAEEEVVVDVVVDENVTSEEGTKSSYGIEEEEEVMGDDLGKKVDSTTTKKVERSVVKKRDGDEEEGATSNETSFTSEVETLEIM